MEPGSPDPRGAIWASRLVGETWSRPDRIGPALLYEAPAVAIDSAGNGLVVWRSEGILAARLDSTRGWEPPESLSPAGYWPGAWLDRRGRGFVAWNATGATAIVRSIDLGDGWGDAVTLLPPAEYSFARGGHLALDGAGRALLLWHLAGRGQYGGPLWSTSYSGSIWSTRGTVRRPDHTATLRIFACSPGVATRDSSGPRNGCGTALATRPWPWIRSATPPSSGGRRRTARPGSSRIASRWANDEGKSRS